MQFNPSYLNAGPKPVKHEMNDIRALYFDIDNTLVPNDSAQLPSEQFRKLAIETGVVVTINLATARSLQRAKHILQSIKSQGISVLSNGAVLYDGKKQDIVADLCIDSKLADALCASVRVLGLAHQIQDNGVDYRWYTGTQYYAPKNPLFPEGAQSELSPYSAYKARIIDSKVHSSAESRSVYKLFESFNSSDIAVSIGHVGVDADGREFTELFIMHHQANKHDALLKAFAIQGLNHENIIAVGDGPNNKVLLELAGVSIAMGNAVPETLSEANFIAPPQVDDGAKNVLQSLVY